MRREEHVVPVGTCDWLTVTVDRPETEPRLAVVLCHGLTGERVGPQQLLRRLGERVVDGGHLCVRFDFRGSGDSSGAFEDTTFARMRDDLHAVCDWASACFRRPLVLGGVSMGGVLPALVSAERDDAVAVLLVSSDVAEGIAMTAPEGGLRSGQFFLDDAFFEERSRLRPRSALAASQLPAAVFYGGRDDEVTPYVDELGAIGVELDEDPERGHLFEDADARRALGERLADWLDRRVGVS
jgi:uncharacterized protein